MPMNQGGGSDREWFSYVQSNIMPDNSLSVAELDVQLPIERRRITLPIGAYRVCAHQVN